MHAPAWLTARKSNWWFIVWRRPNWLLVVLALLGVYESVLPAVASSRWQDRLQPSNLPSPPIWAWVMVVAIAVVIILLENTHHAMDDRAREREQEREEWDSLFADQYDQISTLELDVSALRESMVPALTVSVSPANQSSADGKWHYAVLRVYNKGVETARNCYGKLTSINVLQSANAPALVPANGRQLVWSTLMPGQACVIVGHSEQFLSVAVWAIDSVGPWYLHVQGNIAEFPLTAGIWEIGLEVGADDLLPTQFVCRLTFVPPDSCLVEPWQ